MPTPLDVPAQSVPSVGARGDLTVVDGRTFAVSDQSGDMAADTHGLVHDDLRHLSRLVVTIDGVALEALASTTPVPMSAVVVQRLRSASTGSPTTSLLIRRRWLAGGMREELLLRNTSSSMVTWVLRVGVQADFAHLFDVKAGRASFPATMRETNGGFDLCSPDPAIGSRLRCDPAPDEHDVTGCRLRWTLNVAARSESRVCISVEPVVDGEAVGLPLSCEDDPIDAIAVRQLRAWQAMAPQIVSTDPRLSRALDQSLADLAALRIVDRGHPERVVVAAGAPWFMTLFGRDSLLTSWMTLPFDAQLASGVLLSLAELQGTAVDPVAEEQPGKILHELRRHGGGGPFAARSRYYGTVDATPLFIALAAEAWRWGALSDAIIVQLAPAVDAALAWLLGDGDSDGDGFIDYHRREASGLSNQGWKDSWDGITRVDGTVPASPIALVEVQGYAYAALNGAAELADVMPLRHTAVELRKRAMDLRERFNGTFWDERGWFVLGLDRDGRPIDSLTTNPGHALWSGIADDRLAHRYLDRLMEPTMWTGWGLRTLAEPMAAYDPISYHNGSVWPHDTAICAAGAAHYGRWDVVDRIVDGALDAAMHFDGRPPELFAGIARDDVPVPVAYPSSCSPQAWSSASVLLLLRSMLGLTISADRSRPVLERTDLRGVPDMVLDRLSFAGRPLTVRVREGRSEVGDG